MIVQWNVMYIEQIDLTFYGGECSQSWNHNSHHASTQSADGNKYNSTTQAMSRKFEFYPGEYMVGDIIINPNKN